VSSLEEEVVMQLLTLLGGGEGEEEGGEGGVLIEVRAGTGGDEAALFSGEVRRADVWVCRMYVFMRVYWGVVQWRGGLYYWSLDG
jgi:protein subunit release factor A